MSVTIKIPAALRSYTDGSLAPAVEASDVGEAISRLVELHPDLKPHLLDEAGAIRPFVNVFVGGQPIKSRGGPALKLKDGDVVTLVPAIAGGRS
jgi:molybdopterin converting factor small subunit